MNVLFLFQAVRLSVPVDRRIEAIQLTGIGLITTIDGTQSNGLVAALILLAFVALERNRLSAAALAIALGALIKIFPLAAGVFVVPRRDRWRFAAFALGAGTTLVLLPLVVVPPAGLIGQYRSWYAMGAADALDRGASLMRLLHLITRYDGPNWPIQVAGSALLMLPLILRPARWKDADFRLSFVASVLVDAVIFNHKAEQPSFIIAIVGMAIWYAISPRNAVRSVVTASTFIATVPILIAVAAPGALFHGVEVPLLVAPACCTVAWFTMQGELLELFPETGLASNADFRGISDESVV